jgi:hypothetical protein
MYPFKIGIQAPESELLVLTACTLHGRLLVDWLRHVLSSVGFCYGCALQPRLLYALRYCKILAVSAESSGPRERQMQYYYGATLIF